MNLLTSNPYLFVCQHNNNRSGISLKTRHCVQYFDWTVLPHPPYNPNLATSDINLFGPMRGGLRERSGSCSLLAKCFVSMRGGKWQYFSNNYAALKIWVAVWQNSAWHESGNKDIYVAGQVQMYGSFWRKRKTQSGDYLEK